MANEDLIKQREKFIFEQHAVDISAFPAAYTEIAYANDDPLQTMDVFLPSTEGIWPVVVFIHGGGWLYGGRREECISSVFKVVSQGYAVATIDYRLLPEAYFPMAVNDAKAAIRYLRAHSAELRIDTSKLVVWGNSAGAHISSLIAANEATDCFNDLSMGNPEQSTHVDGFIGWYGAYDFDTSAEQGKAVGIHTDDSLYNAMLDVEDWTVEPEARKYASPVNYVTKAYAKTLLQHGMKDHIAPYMQSVEMNQKIIDVCGPDQVTFDSFPDADHGDKKIKADSNILRCVKFLDSIYYPDGYQGERPAELPVLTFVKTFSPKYDPYEQR